MIIVYILGAVVGVLGVYLLILRLYEHTRRLLHELKLLDMYREQLRISQARQIFPNEDGVYPALWDGEQALDINRGVVFDFEGLRSVTPELVKSSNWVRVLTKAGWPSTPVAENLLPGPAAINWPTEIPLKSVLTEPDVHGLVLGVTVGEDGQTEIVKADMAQLVHVGVGGSSGFGKSVFLRSLAYQLALSQTPVDLAMVDLEGATLAPFALCGRLLYPIADTERDAVAIFQVLLDEMDRRKELYADYPGVDKLSAYNAQADEPLTPVVCIVDEATALLGDKSVESALRTLALRARKYGLWLILAGQDWKANSLDTAIRNQLSSRVQFKAMSKSQSRVLLQQSGAEALDVVGRALAILPGRAMLTMQAPFISSKAIMDDIKDGGPRYPVPGNGDGGEDLEQRVRELWDGGVGICAIADEIYGYHNSRKTAEIKAILGLS